MKSLFSIVIVLFAGIFTACIQAQDVVDRIDQNFSNISSIEVEGSFCSVSITGDNTTEVKLTGEVLASKTYDIKIKHSVNGDKLKVWIERPNNLWGNTKGNLTFTVPSNTNIKVDNSSGSVDVKNIGQALVELRASSGSVRASAISSNVDAFASSGSLSLSDISGDVQAGTSSGSQSIKGIGGNLSTKASSGSIKVEGVNGNVNASTSSGGQSIAMVDGNVQTEATSGSLSVTQITGDVEAGTSSGSIRLDTVTGMLKLNSSSGSQKGTNIKLTGNSSFRASSGSVSMELLNDGEELSFDLSASSGSLSAKGMSAGKNLQVTKGPIMVHGNTSSGSQSYR